MNRPRLDIRDRFPSGMEEYLAANGWHFSKSMCDWAVGMMRRRKGAKEEIEPLTKEKVENLLKTYGVKVENAVGYDCAYVANMARADFFGSSIQDEQHLALFIKDYLDDPDGYEGQPFTRFYADTIGSGTPIPWEDLY